MAEAVVLAQARKLPYPASALSLEAPFARLPRSYDSLACRAPKLYPDSIDASPQKRLSILDRIAAVPGRAPCFEGWGAVGTVQVEESGRRRLAE